MADAEKEYEKYLDSLGSRTDLNYIFHDMLSEITVGHLRGGGGNIPRGQGRARRPAGRRLRDRQRPLPLQDASTPARAGIRNCRRRWPRPGSTSTSATTCWRSTARNSTGKDDVSRLLENTAGKRVVLRIGADASGANAREITVVPVASETQLRHQAWIEGNRRKVDELSGGKLAYVYMPDTGQGGLTSFKRYYFAQVGQARRSSSTSASTAAARWPITSSTS